MKLQEFLTKLPENFVIECLDALPGADRRRLLQNYKCRVKMGANTLSKKLRTASEAKKLHKVLLESNDPEDKRSLFQGWLARRAPLIVALLDAWDIQHNGGFVEDFNWVEQLTVEKVKESIDKTRNQLSDEHKPLATDKAFLIYFAYLEWPHIDTLFNVEQVLNTP